MLGLTIHEPDVALTDAALAILGAYLARRLWTMTGSALPKLGAVMVGGLASAALFGAIFHAFFPADTATRAGFLAWVPVSLSIVLVTAVMLILSLRLLAPGLPTLVRRTIVGGYAATFAAVVLLLDESFTSIVRFYGPALVLLLVAATRQAIRGRHAAWTLIACGLALSVVAALMQQAKIGINPVYFDHNAVYHALQGIALVLIYLGFRRAPEAQNREATA